MLACILYMPQNVFSIHPAKFLLMVSCLELPPPPLQNIYSTHPQPPPPLYFKMFASTLLKVCSLDHTKFLHVFPAHPSPISKCLQPTPCKTYAALTLEAFTLQNVCSFNPAKCLQQYICSLHHTQLLQP